MKKTLLGISLLAFLGISFGTISSKALKAESKEYEEEVMNDISEYVDKTAYLKDEGVTFDASINTIFERDWIASYFKNSNGISFNAKFSSNSWLKEDANFKIEYGANELTFSLANNTLSFNVNNSLNGLAILNDSIDNFDVTKWHQYGISRAYTSEGYDYGYKLMVHVDDNVFEIEDSSIICSEDYRKITISNNTGCNVSVKSSLSNISFEEEKEVYDILGFNGNSNLVTEEGLTIYSSEAGINSNADLYDTKVCEVDYIDGFVSKTSGIEFKLKADAEINKWDAITLRYGTTDIRLNILKNNISASIFDSTLGGTSNLALGQTHELGNYNLNEWNKIKLVRVKEVNNKGFAIRLYFNDELVIEIYDPYLMCFGEYNLVKIINRSNTTIKVKSLLENKEYEEEKCSDITMYGGPYDLRNQEGYECSDGSELFSNPWGNVQVNDQTKKLLGESNGMEFAFKAKENWPAGYDKLKVHLGASEVRMNVKGNGTISFSIFSADCIYPGWGNEVETNKTINELDWNVLKITRVIDANSPDHRYGFKMRIYLNNELVVERIEPYSYMWSYAYNFLEVGPKSSKVNVFFKGVNVVDLDEEDVIITDLPWLYKANRKEYYEDAITGSNVKYLSRIINSTSKEEFVSNTNGVAFKIKTEKEWRTSGIKKDLVQLTNEDILNGITPDYIENNKKYKYVESYWDSSLESGWVFPSFEVDDWLERNPMYPGTSLGLKEEDAAYTYHIYVEFGSTHINFKLTPDKHLYVLIGNSLTMYDQATYCLVDANKEPIIFETGNGIEHSFVITRQNCKAYDGYVLSVYVDDILVTKTVQMGSMADENHPHCIVDNMTGRNVTAMGIYSLDDFKEQYISKLNVNYELYDIQEKIDVESIINKAKESILNEESLVSMDKIVKAALKEIDSIYTISQKEEFNLLKEAYKQEIANSYNLDNYRTKEANVITSLVNSTLENINNAVSKANLDLVMSSYYNELNKIKTKEEYASVSLLKEEALRNLEVLYSSYNASDYSSTSFNKIIDIYEEYSNVINQSNDSSFLKNVTVLVDELFKNVETLKEENNRNEKNKLCLKLNEYAKKENYRNDDYLIITDLINSANEEIMNSNSIELANQIYSQTTNRIDQFEKITKKKGCKSSVTSFAMLPIIFAVLLLKKKKGEQYE